MSVRPREMEPGPAPAPMRRLGPASIASAAVALGATVGSDCILQPFFEKSASERVIGGALAALFGLAGTQWALAREPSESNALGVCATTGAAVLSWFMLCERLARLHTPGNVDSFALVVLPILVLVAAAVGAVLGTLFGLTAIAMVGPVERARARRSLDAPERALLSASVWLAAWGLLFVVLRHPRAVAALVAVAVSLCGLGTVLARDLVRLRFLRALYRGALPGWTLTRVSPQQRSSFLPAYGPYREASLDGRLVPGKRLGGPYRAAAPEAPVARLPLDPREGMRPLAKRVAWCGALMLGVVGLAAARLDPACITW